MDHFKGIVRAIADARSWILLLLPFVIMYFIDPPTTKALAYSVLAIFAMLGVMLLGRKLVLPYFDARDYLDEVKKGNVAAAIAIVAVFGFMATVLIAVVMWVRG